MLWKYKLLAEADALGELGTFLQYADIDDVNFLRKILKEWNRRQADIPTDLMSVAASSMLYDLRDDAYEHAYLILMERAFEANTETLKRMAQTLPVRKGFAARLNSRQRGMVRRNIRVLSNQALDDLWPGDTLPEIDDWTEIGVDEAEPEAEAAVEPAKPARRKTAKPAPKAKTAKAKATTKPARRRAKAA